MKGTYHPEIRYSCPNWLERLRQSWMTWHMQSDWLEASLKARSSPVHIQRFLFRFDCKKGNSKKTCKESKFELAKTYQKRWLTNEGQSALNIP